MLVCLKQNLIQQSHNDECVPTDPLRRYPADKELTVSTRITSNLSSHKNSIDDTAAHRFRKQDSLKSREIKLSTQDTSVFLMNRAETPSPKVSLHRNLFSYQTVLGKGGFGKVWKVDLKKNQNQYALKEMSKAL